MGAESARLAGTLTVIEPPPRRPTAGIREAWQYRATCMVLARRSVMVRYRQAVLGIFWSLLQPLMLVALFNFIYGYLGRYPTGGVPFIVFHVTGVFAYYIVIRQINEGSTSVVANAALLTRVYFPRVYFPLSVAVAHTVDTLSLLVVAIILCLYAGVNITMSIIYLPIFVVVAYAMGIGMSLWFSALNAKYRDVSIILPFLSQVLFFMTPIIYPVSIIPEGLLPIYYLNPLSFVVDGFRWTIGGATPPPLVAWVVSCPTAIVLLITGYIFFRWKEATFPDVI